MSDKIKTEVNWVLNLLESIEIAKSGTHPGTGPAPKDEPTAEPTPHQAKIKKYVGQVQKSR